MPDLRRLLGCAAVGAALVTTQATPALAQEGPADLSLALTGPSTGRAGGSGEFAVDVANTGETEAFHVRVTMDLPPDVSVSSVGVTDDWACVFSAGDMSCELADVLPAGETAETIPVVLSYDPAASGSRELTALAEQDTGGLRIDRATTTVEIESAGPTSSPSPTPAPATTAPAPVATTAAPAPAATTRAPAPVEAEAVVEEPLVEALGPPVGSAPTSPPPSVLPFAVEDELEPTQDPEDEPDLAAVPVDGTSPRVSALVVVVGLLVLAEGVLLGRVLLRRVRSA